MSARLKYLLASLAAILFLWFVWPTPFIYSKSGVSIVRTDRFTGVREFSTPNGWQR